jgi:phage tail-like protein
VSEVGPQDDGGDGDPTPAGGGNGGAPPTNGAGAAVSDGSDLENKRREGALERLKKALAAREVPMPQLEGYTLQKAKKILALSGLDRKRLKVRLVDHVEERGKVVRQRPRPNARIDLDDTSQPIEVNVADRSIIGYLPQLYQRNDLTGRSLVKDLLWVMQHIQFQTDEKLEGLEQYFDPHECPAHFLPGLASWVAMQLEADWPEAKKRSIIKKAVELYHLRGTPRGLRVYLRIFTGVDPVIIENAWPHEGFIVGISSTVGVDTVIMHQVNKAHTFIVHVPLPIDEVDAPTILRIHRIIEREKPIHTDYYLTFAEKDEREVESAFVVGVSSTIGVDTWLQGEAAEAFDPLGGEGSMESSSDEGD